MPGLESDESRLVKLQLDRMDAILRNDAEFDGFKKDSGQPELPSKSLRLLVLMRREPDRLLALLKDVQGAEPAEAATAAFLCGTLNGMSRVPAAVRSTQTSRPSASCQRARGRSGVAGPRSRLVSGT